MKASMLHNQLPNRGFAKNLIVGFPSKFLVKEKTLSRYVYVAGPLLLKELIG